jgi:hypothetical protein
LQNIAVVTSVARLVVSSPTPAIHLGYGETMASIGQGVVGEAHCISLEVVAEEQMLAGRLLALDYLELAPNHPYGQVSSFLKNELLIKLSNSEV